MSAIPEVLSRLARDPGVEARTRDTVASILAEVRAGGPEGGLERALAIGARLDGVTLDAASARVAALSPSELELLKWAALMGRVFWIGGLVVLGRTGKEPPALWGGGEDLALQYRDTLKGLVDRGYVRRESGPTDTGDEAYSFKADIDRERLAEWQRPR